MVLLSGEAGIGKSRITQVLRERISEEPHTRLRYQCSPYYTNSAAYPIITLLERAAGFGRGDDSDAKDARKNECFIVGFLVRWCNSSPGGNRFLGCSGLPSVHQ